MKLRSCSTGRVAIGTLFLLTGLMLFILALLTEPVESATPASGSLGPSSSPVSWDGTALGGGSLDESTCQEGVNCDTFMLTLTGTPADWSGKVAQVVISVNDPSGQSDYDLFIHKGDNSGPLVAKSASGGTPPEVAGIDPNAACSDSRCTGGINGTGVFSVRVVYFSAAAAFQYQGSAKPIAAAGGSPTPGGSVTPTPIPIPKAPLDQGPKIGFENFEAPGVLTNVTSSSQGPAAKTVEYVGHDSGEPSIGYNPLSSLTSYQSDLQTLFISFNDNCEANLSSGTTAADKARSTWVNRPSPTSQFVDSDPIGFTDRMTGRTIAGELTLLSGRDKTAYTDDDGQTWVPSAIGEGLGASVDHQTIGGGPYHAPIPTNKPAGYPNAVYYCSQLPQSSCARSDDGAETFGPAVPVDPVANPNCGGLHGHVKVAPDGTVYLPFNNCNGFGSVIVSEDNGINWRISNVRNAQYSTVSAKNLQDPAVAIDGNNKVYFVMASGDHTAAVATSNDRGNSWQNIYDVGALYGLQNISYPAAIAGDKDRAAVAFYGTTTGGDDQAKSFAGIWHLYVASTFDGGQTWTTTDVTPNDPVQRGCIWKQGGADICRNLLDFFDMTMDKEGRVEVGYVDGCAGGTCVQAPLTAKGNAYTALGVIARQSSGRRLIAKFDPQSSTSRAGMPNVTLRRVGPVVHLSWSHADTGNLPVTSYQVFRGTQSGGETLLATVAGTSTSYDDTTASDTSKTYYYKVLATNAAGTSCGANEAAARFNGDTCTALILQRTPPGHPEQPTQGSAPPSLAIDYIAVGEPPGTNNLLFQMKVGDLSSLPANSRWRIVWNSYASPGEQFYAGMRTDGNGTPTFDYGTIATQVVGLVVGVPTETKLGAALAGSNYIPQDGTINVLVDKTKIGNPQPGDLLGAVNGRTFTGDNTQTQDLERSTLLVDHTFVKAQRDNGEPPATYMIAGNTACAALSAPPAQLLNISTRLRVQTGDNVGIAGFIVTGPEAKQVVVRAIGPSLQTNGTPVQGRMDDPTLELHDGTGAVIATNDNWKDTQQAQIEATGLPPGDERESAIVMTLNPGAYTAIVRGKNNTTGIALAEAYDASQASNAQLANISTRGFVETGDNVMIGGFIAGPADRGSTNIIVRALGPTLTKSAVPNTLADPILELHDANGGIIGTNDDWQNDPNATRVQSAGLAPGDQRESAIFSTFRPGAYTAIVRGKDNTTGVALVEAYNVP